PQPRPSLPAPHTFRERSLRRGVPCGGCGTPLGPHGLVCRVCKVAAHKRCESKVRRGAGGPIWGWGPIWDDPRVLLKVTSPCQPLPPPEL
ncbi:TNS2 protein, partial [Callaeas wilsoni]|nr:TNS2 protein [Callaeas wilsoni]